MLESMSELQSIQSQANEIQSQEEETAETGVYKRPTGYLKSSKCKPRRKPGIKLVLLIPRTYQEPEQAKPKTTKPQTSKPKAAKPKPPKPPKPLKEPKEPKPKSPKKPRYKKTDEPPSEPPLEPTEPPTEPATKQVAPKPKRKYTKKHARWFKSDGQQNEQSVEQQAEPTASQPITSPVQEELVGQVVQPTAKTIATKLLQAAHVTPEYLYQLAKHRTFKLVTKQEQGNYIPAQKDVNGIILVPAFIQVGQTINAGQCSKCRVFANPRVPIYYSTYESQDGTIYPYLCDRCFDSLALCWWNAAEEPVPEVVDYMHVVLHEHLHAMSMSGD